MTLTGSSTSGAAKGMRRNVIIGALGLALVGAIALDTTVVRIGSKQDLRKQAFNPDDFGRKEFPKIRAKVEKNAVDAVALAKALLADKSAAVKKYGTEVGPFPEIPVSLTGTLGMGTMGIFAVAIPRMPSDVTVRVQTGPAINGTSLRDYPGDIAFGDFTNQIQYQNAGAGINRAMSAATLKGLDRSNLTGKTISVTGVFTLINPKNWLITPVKLEVGK